MKKTLLFLAVASMALSSTVVMAQMPDWGRNPTFGTEALTSGFVPDPMEKRLTAGGGADGIEVNSLGISDAATGARCNAGFVTRSPDFRFNFTTGSNFAFLRFYVETQNGADAMLLINQPDGSWRCNDDSFDSLNPTIDFNSPMGGQYDVWVGTYDRSSGNPARLYITELESNRPGNTTVTGANTTGNANSGSTGRPDWAGRPTFGSRDLVTGFTPDPNERRLTAGSGRDGINVATLNITDATTGQSCGQGFVTRNPDFRYNFVSGESFDFLRFYVETRNGADAFLLINQPDGSWRCNDDSFGTLHPTIDFASPASGQYDVWVGTYTESSGNPATLYITELEGNRPQ